MPYIYCKRGYFHWGEISRKCWQDLSRGGNFHDISPISFIKSYGFNFPAGEIFAKNAISRKTRKLPPRENFHVYSIGFQRWTKIHTNTFIAGSAKCSTKPLSILLTKRLTHIKQGLQKNCESAYLRTYSRSVAVTGKLAYCCPGELCSIRSETQQAVRIQRKQNCYIKFRNQIHILAYITKNQLIVFDILMIN